MRAIIFDLDGVIAYTEELHKKAFEMAFAGYRTNMERFDWDKDFAGKGHRYIVNAVFGDKPDNDRLINKWVYYYQRIAHHATPVPGVLDFIDAQRAKNTPMIIATGSARLSANVVLCALGLGLPLVSMEDIEHPKPDPEIFLLAAQRLDVAPADCTVFEDSFHGIVAAKRADMLAIGLTTIHTPKELLQSGADSVITDFTDEMLWT